jgi:hypothetical protein
VARWTASFLAEASDLTDTAATLAVRHVTRMMRSELAELGFYDAVDAALQPATRISEAARSS